MKPVHSASADNLMSVDILPVRCPQCGEAQNTVDGGGDPMDLGVKVGCMVCGYAFSALEYRKLLDDRRRELAVLRIKPAGTDD